ncbi:MAG: hypothetical protein ACOH2V_00965 [Candidatus Saccharimonadaceae bacterium]
MNLTWKELKEFAGSLTDEQLVENVLIADYADGQIIAIDSAEVATEKIYDAEEGVLSIQSDIDEYDLDQMEEYLDDIITSISVGQPVLIID